MATWLPGLSVAARAWWRVPVHRVAGFGCRCAMTTGPPVVVHGPNKAFLPTVGWPSVVGEEVVVPTVMEPVDLELLGPDLGKAARATLVAKPVARSRTPGRCVVSGDAAGERLWRARALQS